MAFMTLRLAAPGVKLVQTPTLVMTEITQSQLIRWRQGLVEKLGGWQQFFGYPIPGPIREMWAWADINLIEHLAAAGDQGVWTITNNSLLQMGPTFLARNPSSFATTAGSANIIVNDVGANASTYDAITLQTPVSVGGIAIYRRDRDLSGQFSDHDGRQRR
jgi:hypothetical protein